MTVAGVAKVTIVTARGGQTRPIAVIRLFMSTLANHAQQAQQALARPIIGVGVGAIHIRG